MAGVVLAARSSMAASKAGRKAHVVVCWVKVAFCAFHGCSAYQKLCVYVCMYA